MSNILVTGANGQLGSELRRIVEMDGIEGPERREEKKGAKGLESPQLSENNLGSRRGNRYIFTDVAEFDITDAQAVERFVRDNDIAFTINCAAYTAVERAEEDEERADMINNRAAGILASAMKRAGGVLIHVSTDYVFGGDGCRPYREDDHTAPTGAYGRTKLAGERAIAATGCRAIIIRTAWLYSPFGNNFVRTTHRLTGERESLNVVFDQVGSPTSAADLAGAIYTIVEERYREGCEGIYHYSNEGVCSWYDFARAIAAEAGHTGCRIIPCRSEEFPSKVRRPHYSVLDKTKIKAAFGLEIPHWQESLHECMERLADRE